MLTAAQGLPLGTDLFSTGLIRTGFGSDGNLNGFRQGKKREGGEWISLSKPVVGQVAGAGCRDPGTWQALGPSHSCFRLLAGSILTCPQVAASTAEGLRPVDNRGLHLVRSQVRRKEFFCPKLDKSSWLTCPPLAQTRVTTSIPGSDRPGVCGHVPPPRVDRSLAPEQDV